MMPYANRENSDQPQHPRELSSAHRITEYCRAYQPAKVPTISNIVLLIKPVVGRYHHAKLMSRKINRKSHKNSAEGVIAPAGAKVTGASIRMWLLNKFISFLAVLTWKTGLKKM